MKYLVVYIFRTQDGVPGTGTSKPCTFTHDPPTVSDIHRMEGLLKEEGNFASVMIVNWLALSDEE